MPIPEKFDEEQFRQELSSLFPEKSASLSFDADQWFRVKGTRLRRHPPLSIWGGLATALTAGLLFFSWATPHGMSPNTMHTHSSTAARLTFPQTPKGVHVTAQQALTVALSYVHTEMSHGPNKATANGWQVLSISGITGPQLQRQSRDITQYPAFMWAVHLYNRKLPTGSSHYFTLYIDGRTGRIAGWHSYNR